MLCLLHRLLILFCLLMLINFLCVFLYMTLLMKLWMFLWFTWIDLILTLSVYSADQMIERILHPCSCSNEFTPSPLEEARMILQRIMSRDLYQFMGETKVCNQGWTGTKTWPRLFWPTYFCISPLKTIYLALLSFSIIFFSKTSYFWIYS